jgi:phospholipid/cholesterol/gamma-HCH transport system substrate-binding protein
MAKRSTEIRVGLLVLAALVLLGGFIFILGNFSLEKGQYIYVDFDFVGNLANGAPVKVSGIKVGKVEEIRFLAGKYDPKVKRRVYVRLKVWVEKRAANAIRQDSEFYINTQGVLGEQYLEITPGTLDEQHPRVKSGAIMRGKTPPRADLIVARLYTFLNVVTEILEKEKDTIGVTLQNAARALETADKVLTENRPEIKKLLVRGDELAVEAVALAQAVRKGLGDGRRLRNILARVERATGILNRRLDPTLDRVDRALDGAIEVTSLVGPKERDKVMDVLDRVVRLSKKAEKIAGDTVAVVRSIRRGKGTAGALVMEREVYEDLRELIRDLKRNPWKFFWKE